MSKLIKICVVTFVLAFFLPVNLRAQFKEEAFTQNYNDSTVTSDADSTDRAFTFNEYFGGLSHKRDSRIGVSFSGSLLFVGGMQIQNRQYWKLPVVYGGLAATAGAGIYYRHKYNVDGNKSDRNLSNALFIGTGLIYWGTLLDGVGNFNRGTPVQAGKATLYSALLPGLGQAYNGEYWKIPIYYAGLVGSAHFLVTNNTNYKRYKRIHNEATNPDVKYEGPVSAETALYYRNIFRRYRDYSIVALVGFYVLQIIDANVFAYMRDFELNDNISMRISPAVITPQMQLASANEGNMPVSMPPTALGGTNAFGMSIGLRF